MVANAKQLTVYEGLPRHIGDERNLEQELARQDVIIFCAQAFYSPGNTPSDDSTLKEVITSPSSLRSYNSFRRSGSFHPDYAVTWKDNGTLHYIFVSLDSSEIIFCSPKATHQYSLSSDALAKLKAALAPYAKKRPAY